MYAGLLTAYEPQFPASPRKQHSHGSAAGAISYHSNATWATVPVGVGCPLMTSSSTRVAAGWRIGRQVLEAIR
jgi:hypothetical protein